MNRATFVTKGEVLDILNSFVFECRQWKDLVESPELLNLLEGVIEKVEKIPEPCLTWYSKFECENCHNFDDSLSEFGTCPYSQTCFLCSAWTGQGFSGAPSCFMKRRVDDA